LCRWFDSAPGHQEHRSRNAHSSKWALSFLGFVVLGSGLYPGGATYSPTIANAFGRVIDYRFAVDLRCNRIGTHGCRALPHTFEPGGQVRKVLQVLALVFVRTIQG
jgi:hypothetical protein